METEYDIPQPLRKQFIDLACRLSPENLSCDGELSSDEVRSRYAKLMERWHDLEEQAGRPVDEEEAFDWFLDE